MNPDDEGAEGQLVLPHEPTEALIASAPHELFIRLAASGYRFDHHRSHGPMAPLRDLIVRAFLDGREVARAEFKDDGPAAHCQEVKVEEGHRRKGLATAMYVLAERAYGKHLWNKWAGHRWQSDAAKAMWANPKRLFGHPKK